MVVVCGHCAGRDRYSIELSEGSLAWGSRRILNSGGDLAKTSRLSNRDACSGSGRGVSSRARQFRWKFGGEVEGQGEYRISYAGDTEGSNCFRVEPSRWSRV